ncbi:hypothetical protein [Burkholderia territorii]|uniref:hypothetical protein n=1 Tax=Burkholderia territorii TaxID=1503055 RepID=UPI0012D90F98|nr:hypothetical protein [Burkholderia territorii]
MIAVDSRVKNMLIKKLEVFPAGFVAWLDTIATWIFINVFWGGAAIGLGTLLNALLGRGWMLPNDFTLGATVLAVVIAATSLATPSNYKEPWRSCTAWCRNFAMLVVGLGLFVGAVVSLKELNSNQELLFKLSVFLLVVSVILGLALHITQLRGRDLFVEDVIAETLALRDDGYAIQERQEQENLKARASHTTKVGDLQI